jgi:hypothetical protein
MSTLRHSKTLEPVGRPAVRLALADALLLARSAGAQSNVLAITDAYTVRRWGGEDGRLEGIVTGVARFPDGFLWLTTPHHVVRFEGSRKQLADWSS